MSCPAFVRKTVPDDHFGFVPKILCTRREGHRGDHLHAEWDGTPYHATWISGFGVAVRTPTVLTVTNRWSQTEGLVVP